MLVYTIAIELNDVQRLEVAAACDLLPSEFDDFEAVVNTRLILKSLYDSATAEDLAALDEITHRALHCSIVMPPIPFPARDSPLFS